MRNMASIGIDLAPLVHDGLLKIHSSRPALLGLEMHLVTMHKQIEEFSPAAVVIDPISNFMAAGNALDATAMLMRLIDYLKMRQVTAFFTHLTSEGEAQENTQLGVSSLTDTWIVLRTIESAGRRRRGLSVVKSRGMKHSSDIREYTITSEGLQLEAEKSARKRK
jgi:circadian clock protein KaiC